MSKVSGAVRVVVPASSANLGSGFDSAGLALSMFDEIEASFTDKPGVQVDVDGEGRNSLPRDENHLIARVMLKTFANLSMPVQGLYLRCINRIPHGRGLGSSAAAISAAVVAARALAGTQGTRMDDQGALELASSLEGHPDNVAACLYGGFTVSWIDENSLARAVKIKAHESIIPVVMIPRFEVDTEQARALLPSHVPHRDATYNISRSALLVHAMTSDPDYLFEATSDRIHQEYRRPSMQSASALVTSLRMKNHAAYISGSGPTVCVLTNSEKVEEVISLVPDEFEAQQLAIAQSGASVQ
ncbi:MAG: homoserine kinase [Actinomycetes bacterium]|jgi:homoserine kinase